MQLEKYRISNNLSYKQLSELLGIEKTRVYRICLGQNSPIKANEVLQIQSKTNNEVALEDLR